MDSFGCVIHNDEQGWTQTDGYTIGVSDSERWVLTENTQTTYGRREEL